MPIYQYECDKCKRIITEFFYGSRDAEEFEKQLHKQCGGRLKKILSVPGKPIIK